MSTEAKFVEFHRQLKQLEEHKRDPQKSKLRPRDRIRIRMRCRLCGRARATYRKYGPEGERVIRTINRVSKPGCRIYRGYRALKPILDGLGISIISTSRGVMSDRQARAQRLGGEVLCNVW